MAIASTKATCGNHCCNTSGAQSDGLTATHGLFTGGEAAHVLRMTYARVAAAVSPVLK